jgi:hypothetical protein
MIFSFDVCARVVNYYYYYYYYYYYLLLLYFSIRTRYRFY